MTWIQTRTGRKFDLANPTVDDVDIIDITHALENIARFNGHTRRFYSVAEHTVRMLRLAPAVKYLELKGDERLLLEGAILMHDAHEAYIGDVPRPIKPMLGLKWTQLEDRIEKVVREKLGDAYITERVWNTCKAMDTIMLGIEGRELMKWPPQDWGLGSVGEYGKLVILGDHDIPAHGWGEELRLLYRSWCGKMGIH